jgi:hypothetical protein
MSHSLSPLRPPSADRRKRDTTMRDRNAWPGADRRLRVIKMSNRTFAPTLRRGSSRPKVCHRAASEPFPQADVRRAASPAGLRHRGRTEGDRRLPNPDIAVAAPRLSTGPLFGRSSRCRLQGAFPLQANLAKPERGLLCHNQGDQDQARTIHPMHQISRHRQRLVCMIQAQCRAPINLPGADDAGLATPTRDIRLRT